MYVPISKPAKMVSANQKNSHTSKQVDVILSINDQLRILSKIMLKQM